MADQNYWKNIIADCSEEFMRILDTNLDLIFREILPQLTELQPPEDRLAFYEGLDWGDLQVNAPKLWTMWSADQLGLKEQELRKQQQADSAFGVQVREQPVFGLGLGEQRNLGLDQRLPGFGG